jgi:AcrR family transcriptional regulator
MDKSESKQTAMSATDRDAGREDDSRARDRILKAAERLFADRGYNGVSVRDIAAAAGVNSAAIAYYFRSKDGLLSEVYRRHCTPLIEERLRMLAAARRLRGRARLAAILEAFVRPALLQVDGGGKAFLRLRAVLSGESSELLDKLVDENFHQSSSAFVEALCECLPRLSRDDVCWRFHFLLGTIYYTAVGPQLIRKFSDGRCDPSDTDAVIRELVPFLVAAFSSPPSKRAARRRR